MSTPVLRQAHADDECSQTPLPILFVLHCESRHPRGPTIRAKPCTPHPGIRRWRRRQCPHLCRDILRYRLGVVHQTTYPCMECNMPVRRQLMLKVTSTTPRWVIRRARRPLCVRTRAGKRSITRSDTPFVTVRALIVRFTSVDLNLIAASSYSCSRSNDLPFNFLRDMNQSRSPFMKIACLARTSDIRSCTPHITVSISFIYPITHSFIDAPSIEIACERIPP